MQLATSEKYSLGETQQQVSDIETALLETRQQVTTIEGKVTTIEGKVTTIESKVDDLGVEMKALNAGLAKLVEEMQKVKEMKKKAEQKDKENAEANTKQLIEAVRDIPMLLQNSGQNLQLAAVHVEKGLGVAVPSAFPLSPSSAGLASSSSSSS